MALLMRLRLPAFYGLVLASSFAQNAPLTLADCQRLAESAPSALAIARTDVRIAQAGIGIAQAGFLPQAALGTGYTYNSPIAGEGSFIALNGIREYQAVATTTVEVDTSGRLRAGLARARADRDISNANLLLVRRDLRRTVATAYYRLLLTRHLVEAAEASLMEAASFRQRAQALFAGGEVARADV